MFHVKFEVKKVQSYIFRYPKWKYIVGANSRLGNSSPQIYRQ